MARLSVPLFLFTVVPVALFGFIEAFSMPPILNIETPEQFAEFRAGALPGYVIYVIKASAHPNTFGEIKSIARLDPVPRAWRIFFEDKIGNYIAINPREKSVDAKLFLHGSNYFRYLPTDYKSYELHTYTTTDTNLDAVEQWPLDAEIILGNAWEPTGATLKRFQRIQETHSNLHFKDIFSSAPMEPDKDSFKVKNHTKAMNRVGKK